MKVFTNKVKGGTRIYLVVNGLDSSYKVDLIGTQAASISTQAAIKRFDPDIVINLGTAGGFKDQGAAIGDVYIISKAYYHDRRILLPGFDQYGIGGYPCETVPHLKPHLKLKKGILTTGNSLDIQPSDLAIIKRTKASVKDMEGAAVVWVSSLYHKPVIVLKSITDYVDYPEKNHEDFIRNLDLASRNLKTQFLKLIELPLKR